MAPDGCPALAEVVGVVAVETVATVGVVAVETVDMVGAVAVDAVVLVAVVADAVVLVAVVVVTAAPAGVAGGEFFVTSTLVGCRCAGACSGADVATGASTGGVVLTRCGGVVGATQRGIGGRVDATIALGRALAEEVSLLPPPVPSGDCEVEGAFGLAPFGVALGNHAGPLPGFAPGRGSAVVGVVSLIAPIACCAQRPAVCASVPMMWRASCPAQNPADAVTRPTRTRIRICDITAARDIMAFPASIKRTPHALLLARYSGLGCKSDAENG